MDALAIGIGLLVSAVVALLFLVIGIRTVTELRTTMDILSQVVDRICSDMRADIEGRKQPEKPVESSKLVQQQLPIRAATAPKVARTSGRHSRRWSTTDKAVLRVAMTQSRNEKSGANKAARQLGRTPNACRQKWVKLQLVEG
jgi:uncharacterized protein YoxC